MNRLNKPDRITQCHADPVNSEKMLKPSNMRIPVRVRVCFLQVFFKVICKMMT